jgi:hypothetical protein
MLLSPPTLAGPGGMPLIGTLPASVAPAIRAFESAGVPRRSNANAIFAFVFDMIRGSVVRSRYAFFASASD